MSQPTSIIIIAGALVAVQHAETVWPLGYTFGFFQHCHRIVDLSLYGFGPAASGVTPLTVKT
jgi:hypothetical protein